ncbi:hypothetical protein Lqui_2862 [Legionella quinlivanii]|uniref:Uncharacterized protein n=2 Tax=Legionella quinlivanii TaxID=45073 RepID=A0A0W0XLC5_9GAMM|nr:hypothetical protein Lqui_2862 [Legionella quinlivanii]SEG14223.1 hypothetical protein SAMN02746093_01968 [Legionella quinlivanii DSM 21216]STY10353.1 Uncharacterised protein [Legionella quinlivanii]
MFMFKPLYRYLFRWESLTKEEVLEADHFFASYSKNSGFKGYIYALNVDLYNALYPNSQDRGYAHVASDSHLKVMFGLLNQQYSYFKEVSDRLFNAFKNYYFLFETLQINEKPQDKVDSFRYAYNVLLCLGDNIEAALDYLDNNCDTRIPWQTLLNYIPPKLPAIEIECWQRLFLEDFIAAKGLFHLAAVIEKALGRPPVNIGEARTAARALQYASRASHPEFAAFCVEHFVPESVYELCISANQENSRQGFKAILSHFNDEQLLEMIEVAPIANLNIATIELLLKSLQTEDRQIKCLRRFESKISNIQKEYEFFKLFDALGSAKAQQQIVTIASVEKLRVYLDCFYTLEMYLKSIKPEFIPDFLSRIVGPEKLNVLVSQEFHYDKLLKFLKPLEIRHLAFLQNLFSLEKLRLFAKSSSSLAAQLSALPLDCHLEYLKDIVGPEQLKTVIGQNYCMLATLLNPVKDIHRKSILFDILGEEEVQATIKSYGDLRARQTIEALIHPEHRKEFRRRLTNAAEKEAKDWVKKQRQIIINNPFKVGLWGMGGGGVDITLPDKSQKRVPGTVGKLWEYSCNARAKKTSYIDAKRDMELCLSQSKKKNDWVTFFSRGKETKRYYKQETAALDENPKNEFSS